ncbi:MAG: GPR endopeptidase [Bacilli bacterium]|nr:GPR endopeptidase [Bacilli bacterium]MDD4733585.1 GPR endopeptidase [Bacilli bacterium]
MGKEIDMSKYQIRTDLVVEKISEDEKINQKIKYEKGIKITDILLKDDVLKDVDKKNGNYITIEYKDITDSKNASNVKKVFIKELKSIIEKNNIKDDDKALIIGLGNSRSTPDSLGPLVINDILVTSYLHELEGLDDGYRNVSAFNPGVMGETGIETSDLIKGIIEVSKPNFLIVIDALASNSVDRLNKTIQMTDTGIHPGSGVGNKRKEISYDTLGIPVIAIGVPTVVDAVTIVTDTINYMYKHISYLKKNMNNPTSKLAIGNNYLDEEVDEQEINKKDLFGLIGDLEEIEFRNLIFDVLTPIGYNLMVTTKEIDFLIEKTSKIIAQGINSALHSNIELEK